MLEVSKSENERGGERVLKCPKCAHGIFGPLKSFLPEEGGEWRGDGAEVLDEVVIVPHQPEEPVHRSGRHGLRPVQNRLNFLLILGHPYRRNHMAQVHH